MEISDRDIRAIVKNREEELSKEEKEENIIEWTTFFRRNLDIFNEDYLGIKISQFQKQRINSWSDNEVQDTLASRGSAKTFDIGIFAIDLACLYSGCQILITSMTLSQSNLIIDEKIDKIFCSEGTRWSSPILCQLRKDGWIEFSKDPNTGARIVNFGNNSKIFAVNCGDSARGKRANVVITDEFVLIKKKDYDEIISPTLEVRKFGGRPIDYEEETKQIFLSSAKNKANWGWKHLLNTVNQHYKSKSIKYGFFTGDIFTAIANGIQTKKQYIQRKKDTDDMSFEQEYLNIFLGNSQDSIFKFEDFEQNQILEKAFYPRSSDDILYNIKNSYKFVSHYDENWNLINDEEDEYIRYISNDIAVATGNENDNTVYKCMRVSKIDGHREVEFTEAKSGLNSLQQVVLMKRYFYEYHASYFVLDTKGVGNVIYDMLTTETYDQEYNITYPAWSVNRDKKLQISSDTVINDKITRTTTQDTKDVVIPYAGTAELNSIAHLSVRKALRDKNIFFLKDDAEMKGKFEEDIDFLKKSAEEKANILAPYVNTRYTINEAISLEAILTDNGIKLKEAKRTDVKDRYMTLAMGNLFADKVANKYMNNDYQGTEIDLSEWEWLKG